MKKKLQQVVEAVRAEAANDSTWADLSNFVFDQEEGLLTGLFPTRAEREVFIKTP